MFEGHLYVSQTQRFGGFLENDEGYYLWEWINGKLDCTWNPWQEI